MKTDWIKRWAASIWITLVYLVQVQLKMPWKSSTIQLKCWTNYAPHMILFMIMLVKKWKNLSIHWKISPKIIANKIEIFQIYSFNKYLIFFILDSFPISKCIGIPMSFRKKQNKTAKNKTLLWYSDSILFGFQ